MSEQADRMLTNVSSRLAAQCACCGGSGEGLYWHAPCTEKAQWVKKPSACPVCGGTGKAPFPDWMRGVPVNG